MMTSWINVDGLASGYWPWSFHFFTDMTNITRMYVVYICFMLLYNYVSAVF